MKSRLIFTLFLCGHHFVATYPKPSVEVASKKIDLWKYFIIFFSLCLRYSILLYYKAHHTHSATKFPLAAVLPLLASQAHRLCCAPPLSRRSRCIIIDERYTSPSADKKFMLPRTRRSLKHASRMIEHWKFHRCVLLHEIRAETSSQIESFQSIAVV